MTDMSLEAIRSRMTRGWPNAIRPETADDFAELLRVCEVLAWHLEDAVNCCTFCNGTGKAHTMGDETEVGCSPGSSAGPCPDCSGWRAALALHRGES